VRQDSPCLWSLAPCLAPGISLASRTSGIIILREKGRRRVSWAGRRGEDGVGSDPPPDDMRLAWYAFVPVAEGRPKAGTASTSGSACWPPPAAARRGGLTNPGRSAPRRPSDGRPNPVPSRKPDKPQNRRAAGSARPDSVGNSSCRNRTGDNLQESASGIRLRLTFLLYLRHELCT
jgi:hypothetical protein